MYPNIYVAPENGALWWILIGVIALLALTVTIIALSLRGKKDANGESYGWISGLVGFIGAVVVFFVVAPSIGATISGDYDHRERLAIEEAGFSGIEWADEDTFYAVYEGEYVRVATLPADDGSGETRLIDVPAE